MVLKEILSHEAGQILPPNVLFPFSISFDLSNLLEGAFVRYLNIVIECLKRETDAVRASYRTFKKCSMINDEFILTSS